MVIVGGGTAGAVLAARLTEDGRRHVVLLEAGPVFPPGSSPLPVVSSAFIGRATGYDWGYAACPGRSPLPRGRMVGGSSAMNGTVAMRALPADFARWTRRGIHGWTWSDVLPDYIRLEHADAPCTAHRGRNGPVPVHQLRRSELSRVQAGFLSAAHRLGYRAADFNGTTPHGAAPYPVNAVHGARVNTAMAYLSAAVRARPHLRVESHALVDRVLLRGRRVTGVALADGRTLHAPDVILSAGTYGSAALLLRSGIGPQRHLRQLGIPVVQALPVGTAYRDHPLLHLPCLTWPWWAGRPRSVAAAAVWTASASAPPGELDLHVGVMQPITPVPAPTFTLIAGVTRPRSHGTITLASRDPRAAPRIRPRWLTDERDRERMAQAVCLAGHLTHTDPLAGMIARRLFPGPGTTAPGRLHPVLRASVRTFHHPTSSAPMGPADDPRAVVDATGRVHGVHGLRVVDASIFPDAPSVPVNLTVIMAAEHLARALR
ncbi:GMC family oxidoreductase [Streptomyces sp. TRM76323]|uniref:GMC family oxidoreductase n=1 Tax=Streptomyces tamarix TaxID=3078565 RepID=A0ABU3QKE4_9ACTN|nr:GMC family oxidoreductase [Streptomyces tamarix]MDT9683126.1 GMC family oxidoreductase [Streptomyces tamarix]